MRTFPEAVCWYEGMQMLPQHFQMQALRHETLAAIQTTMANPWFWGVSLLQIDEAALCAGTVRILRLKAVMHDGLPIDYDISRDPPLTFECATLLPAAPDSAHQLWLAIPPASRAGQWQLMQDRHRSINSEPMADLTSGAFPESIPLWKPLPRIISDTQKTDLICLPLLQVVYAEGGFRQNDWFAPSPTLAEGSYITQHARQICLQAREKCLFLSREIQLAHQNERGNDEMRLSLALHSIQGTLLLVENLLNSPKTHPKELFNALCLFAGQTAILQPQKPLPLLPAFDYLNMHPTFNAIFTLLGANLARIHRHIERHHFNKQGDQFSISLPAYVMSGETLIIGITMTASSQQSPKQWLMQSIISSQPFLPILRRQRMHGMALKLIDGEQRREWEIDDNVTLFAVTLTNIWYEPATPLCISPLHETDSGPERVTLYLREGSDEQYPR